LLGPTASQALTDAEGECFLVVSKSMRGTEEPLTMGRWVLHLIPCSLALAQAASDVAQGKLKATKPRAAHKPSSKP
jgi:hypothetical protein